MANNKTAPTVVGHPDFLQEWSGMIKAVAQLTRWGKNEIQVPGLGTLRFVPAHRRLVITLDKVPDTLDDCLDVNDV